MDKYIVYYTYDDEYLVLVKMNQGDYRRIATFAEQGLAQDYAAHMNSKYEEWHPPNFPAGTL
jgi:hypothetical protein